MPKRSFVNIIRFAIVPLTVALCGALSTPTFADRGDRSRGHDSGDTASASDSKASSHGSRSSGSQSWRGGDSRQLGGSRDSSPSRSDRSPSYSPSFGAGRTNSYQSRDTGGFRSFGRQDTSTNGGDRQSRSYWSSSPSRVDRSQSGDARNIGSGRSTDNSRSFGRQDTSTNGGDRQSRSYWTNSPSRVDRDRSGDPPRIDRRDNTDTRTDSRSFQRSDPPRSNNNDHRDYRSGDSSRARESDSQTPSFNRDHRTSGDSRTPTVNRDFRRSGGDSSHFSDRDSWPRGYRTPTFSGGFYHYSQRPRFRPLRFGFWIFDTFDPFYCRQSLYLHYGYFPYIAYSRVYVRPYVVVNYYDTPYFYGDDGYYLSRHNIALDDALSDIRRAWLDGRVGLIKDHVDSEDSIAVLLDGRYDYSMDADDYVETTSDAIDEMQTVSFIWQGVRQRTNGEFTAFAKHVFRDASGDTHAAYVSYTLRRIDGEYYITEAGSSKSSLY